MCKNNWCFIKELLQDVYYETAFLVNLLQFVYQGCNFYSYFFQIMACVNDRPFGIFATMHFN